MVSCRLYLITPPRLDAAAFSSVMAQALDAGDVAAVQLRLKDVSDDDIRQACDILRPVVQAREAAFLLNDRADLAAEMGCDGVHVGQSDCPYRTARSRSLRLGRQIWVTMDPRGRLHYRTELYLGVAIGGDWFWRD